MQQYKTVNDLCERTGIRYQYALQLMRRFAAEAGFARIGVSWVVPADEFDAACRIMAGKVRRRGRPKQ